MDDLISRQAVLDAIDAYILGKPEECTVEVRELLKLITKIYRMPSEHPELDEWCDDCAEYDKERHCCPRWNRVIRAILEEVDHIQNIINVTLDEDKVARVVEHRKKMQERKKGKENENTVYMQ